MKEIKALKRRLLIGLVSLFVALLAIGVMSGCRYFDPEQDIIESGYIYEVTYDAGEGSFGSAAVEYVRVQEGSLTVEPGYRPAGAGELGIVSVPTRSGYELLGWSLAGEDGGPTYENGEVVLWDFYSDTVHSDITLCAVWERRSTLYISAETESGETAFINFYAERGESYLHLLYDTDSNGQYIFREDYVRDVVREAEIGGEQYTALRFYYDAARTQPIDADSMDEAVYPEDADELTIYADVIEGEYTMVTQEDVDRELLSSGIRWYLVEDIDFGGAEQDALTVFSGSILGNGHKISNLTVRSRIARGNLSSERSIFGAVSGTIENVTFENVELVVYSSYYDDISSPPELNIAYLASSVEEGGAFTGVTITGATVSVVNATGSGSSTHFTHALTEGGDVPLWGMTPESTQDVTGTATVRAVYVDDTYGIL